MEKQIDLKRLGDFFEPEDIEWKPITISKKHNRGLAAAYLTNRAIMDRLDEVCGPESWRNEFTPGPDGGVLCGLSIRVNGEWITKWDGAENTDIEAVKGGLSSAMRRAAVQWGIGRYLYRLPQQWVPVDDRGRFVKPPQVPPAFLPAPAGDGAPQQPAPPAPARPQRPAARPNARAARQAPEQRPDPPQRRERPDTPQRPEPPQRTEPQVNEKPEAYYMPRDLPF